MHLQRLQLHHIGPFDDLDLEIPAGERDDRADVHLLVGANGTGKTTLLEAVAQVFSVRPTGVERRLRSGKAWVAVKHHNDQWSAWSEQPQTLPFDGSDVRIDQRHRGSNRGSVRHVQEWDDDAWRTRRPTFSNEHALVFAYGAYRRTLASTLPGVSPLNTNPLREAALFEKVETGGEFVQWIANRLAQRAIAAQRGDAERAAAFDRDIGDITEALSQVTGISVRFDVPESYVGVDVHLDGEVVPHAVLPAGLDALLSWLGDLLMRLDRLPSRDGLPIREREFVLLLDEIEAHLHPAWQRRVLPVVEQLFPRAQILVATHSPFVISSAQDAFVHRFRIEDGRSVHVDTQRGPTGASYGAILADLMDLPAEFSVQVERKWSELRRLRDGVLRGTDARVDFDAAAREVASLGDELAALVAVEVRQLERRLAIGVAGK